MSEVGYLVATICHIGESRGVLLHCPLAIIITSVVVSQSRGFTWTLSTTPQLASFPQKAGRCRVCSRLEQNSEQSTGFQRLLGHRSRSPQQSKITNGTMSRSWWKTCTVTPIGRSSLLHNGLRVITDHKVCVLRTYLSKYQLPRSCISVVKVRNVHGERLDRELTVTELIDNLRNAPPFASQGGTTHRFAHLRFPLTHPPERERLYGKDMYCPLEWKDWINTSGVLPNGVIPGATGDILSETVETLMSYLGISDTCTRSFMALSTNPSHRTIFPVTPLHKDPCASYGQNIMCYTENDGRSFWFMTNPSDCDTVAEHFRKLGHELDWEDHVATLEELAGAPFIVNVLEQKLGDLVLVPPRRYVIDSSQLLTYTCKSLSFSFHQVVNSGGITIKTSWSRMLIRSLEVALYHELPIYRR